MDRDKQKGIYSEMKAIQQKLNHQEVFNIHEAAQFLRISENTLRGWVRLQQVPVSKINGSIRFRRSKLERWIDLNEKPMS